jgi:ring-1,2-phenylacetyl-CoA epoxidase subunit PaaD
VVSADVRPAAREVVAAVRDPELPDLTIEDLGILRDVSVHSDGHVTVEITPTYAGCPAIDAIRGDIGRALAAAGYPGADVRLQISPVWTTDSITEAGRVKLARAGIAAPTGRAAAGTARPGRVAVTIGVRCPHCGSPDTRRISRFGSTACKALWQCRSCAEPFDEIKAL